MKTVELGKLCFKIRKRRDISQEKLTYGICKQSTYSKFEKDEMILSKNISERLLQRLGISAMDFTFLISSREYAYHEWRRKIVKLIGEKDYTEAMKVLSSRNEMEDDIQRQFYMFIKGFLTNQLEDMEQALLITLPRINHIYFREIAIAADEMQMLLCYWKREGSLLKNPEVLKGCIEYTDLYYADEEKMKLFSFELDIMCQMSLDKNDKVFMQYFELKNHELQKKYRKKFHNSYDCDLEKNYVLINDFVKKQRMERGMTQEEISDGICSVVTYSRFETGKQELSQKNLKDIFERVGLKYSCFLRNEEWELKDIL